MTLGSQLRSLRTSAKLTQGELAEAIGVNQSTISTVENNNGGTSMETLERWVSRCGGTIRLIAGGASRTVTAEALELLDGLAETERVIVLQLLQILSRKSQVSR